MLATLTVIEHYIEHFADTFLCCDWTFVVFLFLYYCTTHHLSYQAFVFNVLPPLNCFCSLLSPFFVSCKTMNSMFL